MYLAWNSAEFHCVVRDGLEAPCNAITIVSHYRYSPKLLTTCVHAFIKRFQLHNCLDREQGRTVS